MQAEKSSSIMRSVPSFPIVGIGASAGGLDVLQRFLATLPTDFGFALVFIQHLPAKHKSLLSELLAAKLPSLVIQVISDGLKVEPGRLYLAPPGKEVRLRNKFFQTIAHPEGLIHFPIDEFLSSLAEDAAEYAIAVIFSGAGTDGARGCQSIRSVGGTVFVQDPETAEFSSMPIAAIESGQADAVLSPEGIAAELLKLQDVAVSREHPITLEEFDSFFRILQEKTGSRFNHYKKSVLTRRIRRRMYLSDLATVKNYLDLVSTNDKEAALLASDLMIGVTSFFRDRVAWKALNLEAVRQIAVENTTLPLRVWTPASATGEEAYSIAMMLLHELALAGKKRDIHVFATDVNDRALERAREGRYPVSITMDVPQEYIQKYFTPTDDANFLVINRDVRECVVFAKQDILTDPPFSKLDLIICRNFLIYLEPEAQEKSISLFHYALNDGGFLFLGNSETVGKKGRFFKSIGHKQCRVYRKQGTKSASRLPITVPYASDRTAAYAAKQAHYAELKRSFTEIIQEKLLETYAPAAVAIDQNYEIIYNNGPIKRYLTQPRGMPTQNLLELVPENLRSRIRGALYRSGHEERPVAIRTNMAGDDNKKRQVLLLITKAAENLHIVVFQEKATPTKKEIVEEVEKTVIEETAIHQLESELSATKADLQNHIEQLKGLNEELQSSNEELQAANEELETSREELQSLNEELITVNTQLHGKIEEQDTTNNDLNNFLASTNLPTIFLDQEFKVKRFTPAMLKLIKLLPSDVGRPIIDMSQENLGPDLIIDAQAVLESLAPLRHELELGGIWYVRSVLPYRTADNRIEGVVVTYNDVTELKRAEEALSISSAKYKILTESILDSFTAVDQNHRFTYWNRATEELTGISANEALGKTRTELFGDTEATRKAVRYYHECMKTRQPLQYENEIVLKDRIHVFDVRLFPTEDGASIIMRDVTERKLTEKALQKNERLLQDIIDGSTSPIFLKDLEGHFITINASLEKMLGMSREEIKGKTDYDIAPKEVADDWRTNDKEVMATGKAIQIEEVGDLQDGHHIFLANKFPLVDSGGQVYGIGAISHDITERKKTEGLLRRQADLLRLSHDAIIVWQLNGGIESWNRGAEQLYGYTDKEVFGKITHTVLATVHPEPWAKIEADLREKKQWEGELRHYTKDGREVIVSARLQLFRGDDDVELVLETNRDITEHKRAEEKLRETSGYLENLFNYANVPVIVWDASFRVTRFNHAFERLTGMNADDVIGKSLDMLFPANSRDESMRLIKNALLGEHWETVEIPILHTNGSVRTVLWNSANIYNRENTKVVATIAQGQDITERKQAEEALRRSEERWNLAIENFGEGAIIATEAEQVIYWNPAARRMHGITSADEGIGPLKETPKTFELWTPDRSHLLTLEEWPMRRIKRGERVQGLELRLRRPDQGWERMVSYSGAMVETANGERLIFLSVYDLTERKQAEEALQNRTAELEVVNKELESFIYSVSHDLRAPIRTMAGFAKFLIEDYADRLDEQGKDYLSRIQTGSEKMSRLIEDLLKLSRISRQEMDLVETDLSSKAASVIAELRETSTGRNVDVVIHPDLKASVDPRLIEVLLSNILGNAWKFTSKTEKARIEFGATKKNGATVYFVKDNGAGFDPAYTDKIFLPFHRLHSDKEFEGTGIGLAIVERIVHRHEGKVWAEGEVGKGTTIYFTLG